MKTRMLALAVAATVAVPGLLMAQGQMGGMQHHPPSSLRMPMGMTSNTMMGMGMVQPVPSFLLEQKDELGLTADQINSLEQLDQQYSQSYQSHLQKMEPLRAQAAQAAQSSDIDLSAYEATLQKLADERVAMQVETARYAQKAMQLLSAEQRSKVTFAINLMDHLLEDMAAGSMMQGGGTMYGHMMHGGMMDSGNGGGS